MQYWVVRVIDFERITERLDGNGATKGIIPITKSFLRWHIKDLVFVRRILRFVKLLTREILSLDGKLLIPQGGIKRRR